MRKKYLLLALLAALLAVFLSCKSTPPPEEKAEPKISQDAVTSAGARADAARKRAMDFDAPTYFPSEWESVEAQYNEAGTLPRETVLDVQRAAALYGEAAINYDGLFEKAVPLYAQAREDEIMAARDELLNSSLFNWNFPDYIKGADAVALKAQDQYENQKDYYAAKDTAAQALEMYGVLKSATAALELRKEIVDNEFEAVDPENFDKAEQAGTGAVDAYDKGDIKSARSNADEAQLRYNLVLDAAWAGSAAAFGKAAATERQLAIDVKGNVAMKSAFDPAENNFKQATASLDAEKFAEAARLFKQSGAQFTEIAELTEKKRVIAEDSIREAAERAEASDEAARRAEEIIEGGSE